MLTIVAISHLPSLFLEASCQRKWGKRGGGTSTLFILLASFALSTYHADGPFLFSPPPPYYYIGETKKGFERERRAMAAIWNELPFCLTHGSRLRENSNNIHLRWKMVRKGGRGGRGALRGTGKGKNHSHHHHHYYNKREQESIVLDAKFRWTNAAVT